MRLAIGLSLVPFASACEGEPPRREDLIGTWRADNGSQLELSADGSLRAYLLGLGCWDQPPFPRSPVSGNGTWRIPERSRVGDSRQVRLEVVGDHRESGYFWYGRDVLPFSGGTNELLCVIGDADEGRYVHYRRQDAAQP